MINSIEGRHRDKKNYIIIVVRQIYYTFGSQEIYYYSTFELRQSHQNLKITVKTTLSYSRRTYLNEVLAGKQW